MLVSVFKILTLIQVHFSRWYHLLWQTTFFVGLELLPSKFMLEGGCVGSHSLCKVRATSQVPQLPTQSPHSRHRVTSRFPPGSCVHGDSWATTHENASLHRTATPVIPQRAHITRQGRKQQTPSLFHGSCHYTPPSSNIFLGSGKP